MGKIHRLEVENFKSYLGQQTIGPFKDFTAVMGPNGAGKSNLMDAISFVVGVRTRQLRGDHLKDLIFNADGKRDEERRKALVTLVYIVSEGELDDVEAGEELHFSRQISATGVGTYRLQGREVTHAEYNKRLKDIGVLVKAKNFLVFQGDVESIASKTPEQLCNFFEEISGSAELIEEYEELKAKKTEAETDTIFTYKQKKGITLEKRQAKEQKDEAERFNRKLKELEDSKCEFFLWRLFHIRHQIQTADDTREELQEALDEFSRKEKVYEDQIKSKKQTRAKALKTVSAAEKKFKMARAEYSKKEPEAIKAKESIAHYQRKVKESGKLVESLESKIEEQEGEKDLIKEDIEKLVKAEGIVEEQGRKDEQLMQDKVLTGEQLEELSQIKEQARSKTVALRAELGTIEREQDMDKERMDQLEHNQKQFQQRRSDLATEMDGLQKRKLTMNVAIENLSAAVEAKQEAFAKAEAQEAEFKSQRAKIVRQLEDAKLLLRNVKAKRAESKKESKMKDVIKAMSRHFEGVHGRLVDICRPTHRRYGLALSLAMGRNMDAVVVSKESTARECIKYLRDQRAGVLTFLPLDTLQVKPTNDRWRNLGDTYRLAVDVLEFEPEVERAVQYALGGVVVCDRLADARRLCFERKERVKAVTLEGDIISRNGDMTGGTTDADHQRASRFEEKELDKARRTRDRLENEIAILDRKLALGHEAVEAELGAGNPRRVSGRRRDPNAAKASFLQDLQMAVANATNRLKFATIDLEMTTSKIDKLEKELNVIDSRLKEALPDLAKLKAAMDARQAEIEDLKEKIRQVESKYLSEFEKKHDIEDVVESEQAALLHKQEFNSKLSKIREQRGKMEAQLRYLEAHDLEKELKKAKKKLKDAQTRLEKRVSDAEKFSEELLELQDNCDKLENSFNAAKKEYEQFDVEIQELADSRDEYVESKASLLKSLAVQENQLEKLRAKRHEELQQAALEQVTLPVLNKKAIRGDMSDDDDSDQNREEDSENPANESQEDNELFEKENEIQDNIDFSSLPSELQKVEDLTEKQVENIRNSLQNKISSLQSEMEKAQPNMRADERYEDVSERLKETYEKLNKARESSKNAEIAFEEVKQKRSELFSKMFQHVEQNIDAVYKELTKSSRYPMGGNAYLTLDNTDEPFLGGIKYNAMPPNKRFRDMEQLSGGEKTVAALALLFAIHSFQPSPFFVMDEVDAALDNANVFKVSNYILKHSSSFQSIVISLKDTFYDKAQALVGIYREQDLNCSKSLSLDLTPYAH